MNDLTAKEKQVLIWHLDEILKQKEYVLKNQQMASYDEKGLIDSIKINKEIHRKLKASFDDDKKNGHDVY